MPEVFRQPFKSRLSNQLILRGTSSRPAGSAVEAAGRASQALLGAFLAKSREDNSAAAAQALISGSGAQPFRDPDTGIVDPDQAPTGGREGAIAALSGLGGNPQASRLVQALTLGNIGAQDQARIRDQGFERQKELLGLRQAAKEAQLNRVRTPEQLEQEIQLRQAGRNQTNINVGGTSPLGKSARDLEAERAKDPGSLATQALETELTEAARPTPKPLTDAQTKVDTEFAKDYNEFLVRGGMADVQKNLSQLGEVASSLETGRFNLTGPVVGNLPNAVKGIVAPEAQAAQDAVEEVVQRNLRLVLGAQFTEKEGVRLIARAYNPALDEKENAKRVRRLGDTIAAAAQAKLAAAQFFEANGSLVGFEGSKQFTIADIEKAFEAGAGGTPESSGFKVQRIR